VEIPEIPVAVTEHRSHGGRGNFSGHRRNTREKGLPRFFRCYFHDMFLKKNELKNNRIKSS
jgi:hypothetical protein